MKHHRLLNLLATMRRSANTPHVIILRGLSGAGKTTAAESMRAVRSELGEASTVVSANAYFRHANGIEVYDETRVADAHEFCKSEFMSALAANDPFVIVDNTNIRVREFAFYVDEAVAAGCCVSVLSVGSFTPEFAKFAAARSVHKGGEEYNLVRARSYERTPRGLPLFSLSQQDVGYVS